VIARRRRAGRGQGGLTLIELMITLALVSIAVGLTFRIFAASSVALRGQTRVSNLQQTLRSAKQLLATELRMAGYMSNVLVASVDANQGGFSGGSTPFFSPYRSSTNPNPPVIGNFVRPLAIVNSSTGPDMVRVVYADPSRCSLPVDSPATSANAWNPTQTVLKGTGCFQPGDLVVAALRLTLSDALPSGSGCVLRVTGMSNNVVQHGSAGGPWNTSTNNHCSFLNSPSVWNGGFVSFYHLNLRAYRVKPDDNRGVLQVSPSGAMVANDWVDVALGISDLQLAVRQLTDTDMLPPEDDPVPVEIFTWLSGENLEGALTDYEPGNGFRRKTTVTAVTLSLVGRADTDGPGTLNTPLLLGDPANASNNSLGDRDSEEVGRVTDTRSPLFGNNTFRSLTTMIDLRNLGTSAQEASVIVPAP
jgi:prepilin-type N-terminal cleavage/methylation domain-containing protein